MSHTEKDLEICRLVSKIRKVDKWLNEIAAVYSPPRHCCPSCAYPGYADECARQDRRVAWLIILAEKQGKGRLAERIRNAQRYDLLEYLDAAEE